MHVLVRATQIFLRKLTLTWPFVLSKDVAALMVQTRQQIENDDHYSAMRTIEIIKGEVKMIKVQAMVDFVNKWLPVAVNKLLYGAKQEAETFLQQRRKNLETIGLKIPFFWYHFLVNHYIPNDYRVDSSSQASRAEHRLRSTVLLVPTTRFRSSISSTEHNHPEDEN